MKKEKKKMGKGKIALIVIGAILLLLIAAILVWAFAFSNVGAWLVSKWKPESQDQKLAYVTASDTARQIAEEGFVLMQNDDNLLPLTDESGNKTKLNLFGIRSIQMVYNGGGSAASDVTKCVRLEDALTAEGFELNNDLLNVYYNYFNEGKISLASAKAPENSSASAIITLDNAITIPELPASAFSDASLYADGKTLMDHAKEFSDVAVVVLSRGAGEHSDLNVGDLQLTVEEYELLDNVTSSFEKAWFS